MKEDITPTNAKNQRHGYWELYWLNLKLHFKCVYVNGKENGFEEVYWNEDGKVRHKNYYL